MTGLQVHQLSHSSSQFEEPTMRVATSLITALYLVILNMLFVLTKSVPYHRNLTINICSISGISSVSWYLSSTGQYLVIGYTKAPPHWSTHACLVFSLFQTVVTLATPLGPPLYQDMSKLYSNDVAAKLEQDANLFPGLHDGVHQTHNVNEEVSASIIGLLFFNFTQKVTGKTSSMEQVDVQDLPVAPALFRTQNILLDVVNTDDKDSFLSDYGGSATRLLWAVWSPEWRSLLICSFLIVLGSTNHLT